MADQNKEILETLQYIVDNMATMDYVDQRIRHTEVLIETQITKRIDSLFDGYKLTHEKQYELERQNEAMKLEIETIKERLTLLERAVASA